MVAASDSPQLGPDTGLALEAEAGQLQAGHPSKPHFLGPASLWAPVGPQGVLHLQLKMSSEPEPTRAL